jgi:hypothetical protein
MPTEVKGALELRKALRKFTPDLAKETQKEIAGALKPIVKTAKGYVPDDGSVLSGWLPRENSNGNFPTYSARQVKAGLGYKTSPSKPNRRGFRSLARVFNKTAAGAIYETMGRKNPSSRFVTNQNAKYGSTMKGEGKMEGRAIYRAYEENQGKAKDAVLKALNIAADKLNATAKVKG